MSDKRPTRDEVARAAGFPSWNAIHVDSRPPYERITALFGGYAPEPVEVPELERGAVGRRFDVYVAGTSDTPSADAMLAALARSNAWEEVKKSVLRVPQRTSDIGRVCELIDEIVARMSAPEFGVGPEVKE